MAWCCCWRLEVLICLYIPCICLALLCIITLCMTANGTATPRPGTEAWTLLLWGPRTFEEKGSCPTPWNILGRLPEWGCLALDPAPITTPLCSPTRSGWNSNFNEAFVRQSYFEVISLDGKQEHGDILERSVKDTFSNVTLKDGLFWSSLSSFCNRAHFVFKQDNDENLPPGPAKEATSAQDHIRLHGWWGNMWSYPPLRESKVLFPTYAGGGGVLYVFDLMPNHLPPWFSYVWLSWKSRGAALSVLHDPIGPYATPQPTFGSFNIATAWIILNTIFKPTFLHILIYLQQMKHFDIIWWVWFSSISDSTVQFINLYKNMKITRHY